MTSSNISSELSAGSSSNNETEVQDENEDERMCAALSFVIILIVIGIPLWWKMTEVERSYFPYDDISDLNSRNLSFPLNITIFTSSIILAKNLTADLQNLFSKSILFEPSFATSSVLSDISTKSVYELENMAQIHVNKPGVIQLIEVSQLESDITIGKHRTVYFVKGTDKYQIYDFLQETVLHEKILVEAVKAVISPGYTSDNLDYLRKMRPSPKYDVIFTIVNPEPKKVDIMWNSEKFIANYFRPLVQQLNRLSEFNVKSQWLYFVDLHQTPKKVEDRFEFNEKQIPHIITPLEKKIGSGVAKNPCINFVLYINKCEYSPTLFVDGEHSSNAVLSARWGGIQLINPTPSYCEDLEALQVNPRRTMAMFIKQFKTLIGLTDLSATSTIVVDDETTIYPWEMDALYRIRILEQFISSKLTLTSLSQLLGEINNIVITKEVGNAVLKAVQHAGYTLKSLQTGNLIEALNYSTNAFVSSEFAFTHPSLLALLYFPDDQKYAVYIPLYLPVMIPVLLSLKNIYPWIKKKLVKGNDDTKKND